MVKFVLWSVFYIQLHSSHANLLNLMRRFQWCVCLSSSLIIFKNLGLED